MLLQVYNTLPHFWIQSCIDLIILIACNIDNLLFRSSLNLLKPILALGAQRSKRANGGTNSLIIFQSKFDILSGYYSNRTILVVFTLYFQHMIEVVYKKRAHTFQFYLFSNGETNQRRWFIYFEKLKLCAELFIFANCNCSAAPQIPTFANQTIVTPSKYIGIHPQLRKVNFQKAPSGFSADL